MTDHFRCGKSIISNQLGRDRLESSSTVAPSRGLLKKLTASPLDGAGGGKPHWTWFELSGVDQVRINRVNESMKQTRKKNEEMEQFSFCLIFFCGIFDWFCNGMFVSMFDGGLSVPRLTVLLSRRTVHSSMVPKGLNSIRTSLSVTFLDSMPTNSLRSANKRKWMPINPAGGRWQHHI